MITDNPENNGNTGGENQRIGRELYQRDKEQNQQRNHGAQDRQARQHDQNFEHNHPTYERSRNADLNTHYGSSSGSPYRNEQSRINHGDRPERNYNQHGGYMRDGSQLGNYSDQNDHRNDMWREGPGSQSRYKEDDYRYGSGSHNWYREGRYSPDSARPQQDQRGFFERVKDGWNDIMNSDNPDYVPRNQGGEHDNFDRERRGSEVFRDRNFNRNHESGSRRTNETGPGNDDYYKDSDQRPRSRR